MLLTKLPHLMRGLVPDLQRVLQRLPVPTAAAIGLTAYLLFELHKPGRLPADLATRLPLWLGLLLPASLAAAIWCEATGRPRSFSLATGLATAAGLALLVALADTLDLNYPLLATALFGLIGIAPFLRSADNGRYWQFNHDVWTGLAFSLIAIVVFFAGISAIIETLRYLFGINIPHWLHEKIWIIACGLVAPLNWFGLLPTRFDDTVQEGAQSEFVSRAIAGLVRYVLVPLLFVYALILHAYALKILVEMAMPKGRIGWMVLSYAGVMAATALLSYPTREAGGGLVARFWRWWPLLLVVPAVMLFIAVGVRIRQYGLTEQRYLVLLAGVWIVLLVALQGWRAGHRRLTAITGSLIVLLIAASFGPWGAAALSNRSQLRHFVERLEATGLAANGKLKAQLPDAASIPLADRVRLISIIDDLAQRQRLSLLQPVFAGVADDPFARAKPPAAPNITPGPVVMMTRDHDLARAIKARLKLPEHASTDRAGVSVLHFNAAPPHVIEAPAATLLIGPLSYWRNDANKATGRFTAGDRNFDVELTAGSVRLTDKATGAFASFDVTDQKTLLAAIAANSAIAPQPGAARTAAYQWKRDGGSLDAELIVTNASAQVDTDGKAALRSITIWVRLAR